MHKKFLIYFNLIVCSASLLVSCRNEKPAAAPGNESSIKWVTGEDLSDRTLRLSLESLARAKSGGPALPRLSFELVSDGKKSVLLNLKSRLGQAPATAQDVYHGLRSGFTSPDALLVDTMKELFINGREFVENGVPWSEVGIKVTGEHQLRLSLRRKALAALHLVLEHPDTWPKTLSVTRRQAGHGIGKHSRPPNHIPGSMITTQPIQDALIRANLVISGEADFADPLPGSLAPLLSENHRLLQTDTGFRYFLVINPAQGGRNRRENRQVLTEMIDRGELGKFVEAIRPSRYVINRSAPIEERAAPASRWFGGEGSKLNLRPAMPLPGPPLAMNIIVPYPSDGVRRAALQIVENLTAQFGRTGISLRAEPTPAQPKTRGFKWDSMSQTDLVLICLPALPLAAREWGEVFSFFTAVLQNKELEALFNRWSVSQDDPHLEVAIEKILVEEQLVLIPLGQHRRFYARSERVASIIFSPFGYWDWSSVISTAVSE